ncbi:alpha-dioxygenase 1-like protein, partial [Tanacetum coccineum]
DGSAIYGSNSSHLHQVRTYKEGKLKIANDGLIHHDENGLPITGLMRNDWIGVSTLQALFILEHNVVCDTLKVELGAHVKVGTQAVSQPDWSAVIVINHYHAPQITAGQSGCDTQPDVPTLTCAPGAHVRKTL